MARLRQNDGRYRGEGIDIDRTLQTMLGVARAHGWQCELLPFGPGRHLTVLSRALGPPRRRIYLSTGIHGDEPAGPLALGRLLEDDRWPEDTRLWLCPCLNPGGFPANSRFNAQGQDLNRDYRDLHTHEVRAHVSWLRSLPRFDLTLCLHEDWEAEGFYLYELNPDGLPSVAEIIMESVAKVCPIDPSSVIDGRPARGGIIRPDYQPQSRPDWPEAFYLMEEKTRLSYTLEAPSDYPMTLRVDALVAGVRAALECCPVANGPEAGLQP